jgi:hypothetical protein
MSRLHLFSAGAAKSEGGCGEIRKAGFFMEKERLTNAEMGNSEEKRFRGKQVAVICMVKGGLFSRNRS